MSKDSVIGLLFHHPARNCFQSAQLPSSNLRFGYKRQILFYSLREFGLSARRLVTLPGFMLRFFAVAASTPKVWRKTRPRLAGLRCATRA
ncbi:MAG: hypothetical protein HUU34_09995 [Saprospiraceae bacterium]|nr:hypothetical protein [Saprospiraceae bacterium]